VASSETVTSGVELTPKSPACFFSRRR
jgi:hypothetical protein